MIEKLLKNDLSKRRWRVFKRQRMSVVSIFLLLAMAFFSYTGEFWANSKPVYLSYKGKTYFPVLFDYHPTVFEMKGTLITDYRRLELSEGDFAIWPLIDWDPYESNKTVANYPSPPTSDNVLGTDDRGRDVLARIVYGFRYSMTFAILVWLFSTALGVLAGSLMGYFGGLVDLIGQRILEIWGSIPFLFLILIVIAVFGASLPILVAINVFFGWGLACQYTRAEFLKNRKLEYSEAARAIGGGHMRVIFRHLLPNSLVSVITFTPFIISGGVSVLAGLDYLGFGLPPPTPSWGELLEQAQNYFTIAWWLAIYPSIALTSTLILLTLLGNGVRKALDPNG